MLKIGDLTLRSNLILAPMAGISDLPFRLLNRGFGCELAFVEMINVRSLGHKNKKTRKMLTRDKKDRPLGVQILGCEPEYILKGMDALSKNYEYDILDFNAACPVKKVTRRGEGAALLKEPKKLHEILKLIVKNSQAPVTVKIRTGWDSGSVNAKETALASQDAGVSAIFVHGRDKAQGYSGDVDYVSIKKVKDSVGIPVIASGNIFTREAARETMDKTGCDAALVARGALGNPWIFKGVSPSIEEIADVMERHFNSCVDFYDVKKAVKIFRKFFGWYAKGFSGVRQLRQKAYGARTKEDIMAAIKEFRCQKGVLVE
ncbi:MAG: tRNA dihydrouridine synthase DusB [Candidatus Omnitrophota bacterium]